MRLSLDFSVLTTQRVWRHIVGRVVSIVGWLLFVQMASRGHFFALALAFGVACAALLLRHSLERTSTKRLRRFAGMEVVSLVLALVLGRILGCC